jgi:TonB family protein
MRILSVVLVAFFGLYSVACASFTEDELANTYSIKEVETPPVPVKQSVPVLSEDLVGQAGRVYVGFIVDARGKVVAPRVVKSENDTLNDAAMECVYTWEFKPAQVQGSSVSMRVVVPIRFS